MLWQTCGASELTAMLDVMAADNAAWLASHVYPLWGGALVEMMWGAVQTDASSTINTGTWQTALVEAQARNLKIVAVLRHKSFEYSAGGQPSKTVPADWDNTALAGLVNDGDFDYDKPVAHRCGTITTNVQTGVWVRRHGANLWVPVVRDRMIETIQYIARDIGDHPALHAFKSVETSNITGTTTLLQQAGYPANGSGSTQSPAVYRQALDDIYSAAREAFPTQVEILVAINWIEPNTPYRPQDTLCTSFGAKNIGLAMTDLDCAIVATQYRDYIWPNFSKFPRRLRWVGWSPQTQAETGTWDGASWNGCFNYGGNITFNTGGTSSGTTIKASDAFGPDSTIITADNTVMTGRNAAAEKINELGAGHIYFSDNYTTIVNALKTHPTYSYLTPAGNVAAMSHALRRHRST